MPDLSALSSSHRVIRISENSIQLWSLTGFPGSLDGKEFACNEGDLGLIPGLGRSLGEGNSYPLQYSGLKNSMDRGTWWATVYGVTKGQTRLSDYCFSLESDRP